MSGTNRFDGLEVDAHRAKFAGVVELDPSDADALGLDAEALAVVTFRVGGASINESSSGDIVRVNKFNILQFEVVTDRELRETIYESMGLDQPPLQLPFPVKNKTVPVGVDANGEILEDVLGDEEEDVEDVLDEDPVEVSPPVRRSVDALLQEFLSEGVS